MLDHLIADGGERVRQDREQQVFLLGDQAGELVALHLCGFPLRQRSRLGALCREFLLLFVGFAPPACDPILDRRPGRLRPRRAKCAIGGLERSRPDLGPFLDLYGMAITNPRR
jgi:hypothetical protein